MAAAVAGDLGAGVYSDQVIWDRIRFKARHSLELGDEVIDRAGEHVRNQLIAEIRELLQT